MTMAERSQIDAGAVVARTCQRGDPQRIAQLASDWPDLADALGRLMRAHGKDRPAGW